VSKNHAATTLKAMAELNIHLEVPVSIKTAQQVLHKSNIHRCAATVKLLITENSAKRQKRWCDDHKTWTTDDWKYQCVQMCRPHHSHHRPGLCLENAKEAYYS